MTKFKGAGPDIRRKYREQVKRKPYERQTKPKPRVVTKGPPPNSPRRPPPNTADVDYEKLSELEANYDALIRKYRERVKLLLKSYERPSKLKPRALIQGPPPSTAASSELETNPNAHDASGDVLLVNREVKDASTDNEHHGRWVESQHEPKTSLVPVDADRPAVANESRCQSKTKAITTIWPPLPAPPTPLWLATAMSECRLKPYAQRSTRLLRVVFRDSALDSRQGPPPDLPQGPPPGSRQGPPPDLPQGPPPNTVDVGTQTSSELEADSNAHGAFDDVLLVQRKVKDAGSNTEHHWRWIESPYQSKISPVPVGASHQEVAKESMRQSKTKTKTITMTWPPRPAPPTPLWLVTKTVVMSEHGPVWVDSRYLHRDGESRKPGAR
ncbi:hypothetical protein BZA05DRAFT_442194 [Tricharina praecox]|uniref:uncharacterized protein n=1 Tax=Tricharina praecox TaxID=43433 RepID=UPI0022205126|nr:uncharacterized protein BZA05DRAFT_442194 [Tricharina praecox]KAI5856514.1 hypothetical protein BZA05DRAFT_442194 [Tricharina praecox]